LFKLQIPDADPVSRGSKCQPTALRGLHLVVSDIDKARAVLIDRGAEVGPVEDLGGVFYAHRRADHAGQDGGS
jgi:hypothetical protein